jgi:hypothetical protein
MKVKPFEVCFVVTDTTEHTRPCVQSVTLAVQSTSAQAAKKLAQLSIGQLGPAIAKGNFVECGTVMN